MFGIVIPYFRQKSTQEHLDTDKLNFGSLLPPLLPSSEVPPDEELAHFDPIPDFDD